MKLNEVVKLGIEKYNDFETKPDEFIGLKQYIFLRRLLELSFPIYREMILKEPKLIGKVYTPEISNAIKYFHIINSFFDKEAGPFIISLDNVLAGTEISKIKEPAFNESAKNRVKQLIIKYAVLRHNHFAKISSGDIIDINDSKSVANLLSKLCVVITDGERILGIGDQGTNGAEISFGKLNCYFLGIGFNPANFLPIGIDIGTGNTRIIKNEFYNGLKKPRLNDEQYYPIVHLILDAIADLKPSLVQFEDFKGERAWPILEWFNKNKKNVPCFNDDSQGTGSVVVSGIMAAEKQGIDLKNSYFLFHGAGGAGIGIAQQVEWLLMEKGLKREDAKSRIIMIDSAGVLYEKRTVKLRKNRPEYDYFQKDYVLGSSSQDKLILFMKKRHYGWKEGDLIEAVDAVECFGINIFLGTSTTPNQFTEKVIAVARNACMNSKILVLAMSNPTEKCEILSDEESLSFISAKSNDGKNKILSSALLRIIKAAEGDIIIGTGSPFPNVNYNGKLYAVGQANNVFIFPGLAYGIFFLGANSVTKEMFLASAKGLAMMLDDSDYKSGKIYPLFDKFSSASKKVAACVAMAGIRDKKVFIRKEHLALRNIKDDGKLLKIIEKEIEKSLWYENQAFYKRDYDPKIIEKALDFDFEKVRKMINDAKQSV